MDEYMAWLVDELFDLATEINQHSEEAILIRNKVNKLQESIYHYWDQLEEKAAEADA